MATFWYAAAWLGKFEVHRRIEEGPWERPRRVYLKVDRRVYRTGDPEAAKATARAANQVLAAENRKAMNATIEGAPT